MVLKDSSNISFRLFSSEGQDSSTKIGCKLQSFLPIKPCVLSAKTGFGLQYFFCY